MADKKEEMFYNKIWFWIIALVIFVIGAGTIMEPVEERVPEEPQVDEEEVKTPEEVATNHNGSQMKYPSEEVMRQTFMEGCATEPKWNDYCSCVFDYMIEEEGRKGMMDSSREMMETGDISPAMLDSIDKCVKHIPTTY